MERNVVYVTESYMLNRVFTKRLCVQDRERCAGLEVGRGRVRLSKCVRWCMCYMRSCEGRTNRERWLLCYGCSSLCLSLSHTHTHTSKLEDRSLMYTQCIGIYLCLTHAWSFAHSHLSMFVSHAHRLHIALPPQHTYGHIHTFSLSHTHKISIKKTRAHLKRPNPNKHELELNSNIWKYCSVKNFHRKKSWVIFEDCFNTHKKVRWMSFECDTVTHRSIDRAAAIHTLA